MTTREVKHSVRLQEWGQMVKRCQESGLTVAEWCTQNGLKPACYYYRLPQVRKALLNQDYLVPDAGQELTVPTLVKVNLSPAEQPQTQAQEVSVNGFFQLRFNSTVLEIPVGTAAEDIAEVLKAMRQYAF